MVCLRLPDFLILLQPLYCSFPWIPACFDPDGVRAGVDGVQGESRTFLALYSLIINAHGTHEQLIIFRYFAKEVFLTMFAVSGIVLVISMGWRFAEYLQQAAAGDMTSEVLFVLMAYRLPGFLELIIPVGFFLAIMLSYGRMHVDSEMLVLHASGVSNTKIVGITLCLSLGAMLFTAMISLWLKPLGERQVEALLAGQRNLTEFDAMIPGRFQMANEGKRVAYTEDIAKDGELTGVFINDFRDDLLSDAASAAGAVTVIAERGATQLDADGKRRLVLNNGTRYRGLPGQSSYQIIEYEEYGQLVESQASAGKERRRTAISTLELLTSEDAQAVSELHWRISVLLMLPVLALMAVPLSRVNPRQGRFTRLVPGMLLCFLYVVSLSAARSELERGGLPLEYGLWGIQGIFIAVTACLYRLDRWLEVLRRT